MKSKLISESGRVSIILTPENEFEKDIIEKVYLSRVFKDQKEQFSIDVDFRGESNIYGHDISKHRIEIEIIQKELKTK